MKILEDREAYEYFEPTREIATPHPMQTDLYEVNMIQCTTPSPRT